MGVNILDHFKTLANKRDVPYQSLLKMFLSEQIDTEVRKHQPRMIGVYQ